MEWQNCNCNDTSWVFGDTTAMCRICGGRGVIRKPSEIEALFAELDTFFFSSFSRRKRTAYQALKVKYLK